MKGRVLADGSDGGPRIVMNGNVVKRTERGRTTIYIDGAEMCGPGDKPCEFARSVNGGLGRCQGANEHCSYEGRGLPEGCTFYADMISFAGQMGAKPRAWNAQARRWEGPQ